MNFQRVEMVDTIFISLFWKNWWASLVAVAWTKSITRFKTNIYIYIYWEHLSIPELTRTKILWHLYIIYSVDLFFLCDQYFLTTMLNVVPPKVLRQIWVIPLEQTSKVEFRTTCVWPFLVRNQSLVGAFLSATLPFVYTQCAWNNISFIYRLHTRMHMYV